MTILSKQSAHSRFSDIDEGSRDLIEDSRKLLESMRSRIAQAGSALGRNCHEEISLEVALKHWRTQLMSIVVGSWKFLTSVNARKMRVVERETRARKELNFNKEITGVYIVRY